MPNEKELYWYWSMRDDLSESSKKACYSAYCQLQQNTIKKRNNEISKIKRIF